MPRTQKRSKRGRQGGKKRRQFKPTPGGKAARRIIRRLARLGPTRSKHGKRRNDP